MPVEGTGLKIYLLESVRRAILLFIITIAIPFLLLVVWLTDQRAHELLVITGGVSVFVALGVFRALYNSLRHKNKPVALQGYAIHLTCAAVFLPIIVGPVLAGIFSYFYPARAVPIVVTIMCIASLVSIYIESQNRNR
jgi:hypothetical protein